MSDLAEIFGKAKRDDRGCLVWGGTKSAKGHAIYNHKVMGPVTAARYVYTAINGRLRGRQVVMMTCGNRLCIEPAHMRTGTHAEAYRNAIRLNGLSAKQKRGAEIHTAKLDEVKVAEIRSIHKSGTSKGKLARLYSVSHRAIDMVVRRKSWAHVGGES